MFSLSRIFLFPTHPPSFSLLSVLPGEAKRLTSAPPPLSFSEKPRGKASVYHYNNQAALELLVRIQYPHLHGALWLATVIIVPLRRGAAGPHWLASRTHRALTCCFCFFYLIQLQRSQSLLGKGPGLHYPDKIKALPKEPRKSQEST